MNSISKILEGLDRPQEMPHSDEAEKDGSPESVLVQNRKELDRVGYLGHAGIPQSLQNRMKDVQTDSVFGGSNDMKRFGIGGFRDASVYAIQAEIKRESEDIIDVKGSVRRENTIRKNMTQGMSDIRAAKRVRCFQVLDFRALDDIESCSDLSFNFHSSNKIDSHIPKYIKNVHSFRIVFGTAKNAFQLRNDDEEVENKKSNNSDAEDSGEPFPSEHASHSMCTGEEIRFGWDSSNPTLVRVAPLSSSSSSVSSPSNSSNIIEEISSSPSETQQQNTVEGRVLKQNCAWTIDIPKGRKYLLQLRIASHCPLDDENDVESRRSSKESSSSNNNNINEALQHLTLNDTNILQSRFHRSMTKDKRVFEVVILLEKCQRVTLSMDNNDKIVLISACLYGPFGNVTSIPSTIRKPQQRHSKALRLGQSLCRHILIKDRKLNTSLFFLGVKHFLELTPSSSVTKQEKSKSPFRHVGQWLASAAKDTRLPKDTRARAIHVLVEMTTVFDHIDLELLVASTLCELSDLEETSLSMETIRLLQSTRGVVVQDEEEDADKDKTMSSLHILLESLHRNTQSKTNVSNVEMIEMAKFALSVIRRCMSRNEQITSKGLDFVKYLLLELDYSVNEDETLSQKLFHAFPKAAVRHIIIETLCKDSTRSVGDLRVFLDRAMGHDIHCNVKRRDIQDEISHQMERDVSGYNTHFLNDSKYVWLGSAPSLQDLEYVDRPLQVMNVSLREKIEETLSVAIEFYTSAQSDSSSKNSAIKNTICNLLPLASSRHRTKLCEMLFGTPEVTSTKAEDEDEEEELDSKENSSEKTSSSLASNNNTPDPHLDNFLRRLEREKLGQCPNNSWWDVSTIKKGDYVDVLDTYGWWWVGEVVDIFEDEDEESELRFEIRYRGFNPRWNEEVVANGGRISRLGTHTGEVTRDGVSVLDPETEVTGYRILFLNVNNVPQRSGIVEKIAWSDGWVRPESDKTPSRFRGWQRIDKEPMWVPSKSCSHTVRGAKLQWLIRWDGTSKDTPACWVDAQRVNPERPRDEVFCFVLDPHRTNSVSKCGLSSLNSGSDLVGCRLLRFSTDGIVSDSTNATRWEESSILAYAPPAQVAKDSSYDRQESEGGRLMLGGPQGILQTENAPFKKRTAVLICFEKEVLLRSVEWQVQSKSGEWQAMRFIPQYSVERAFREKRKWLQIVDDNEIWQITFDEFAERPIQEYTMQRRQPIFTRENTVREEIHDMRNIRRVKRILPSRAHQNSSSIIQDYFHLSSAAFQAKNSKHCKDGDIERRLLRAQKEALVVSHGLGLAWRDWNESTRTMTVRCDGYLGVPLAAVVFVDRDPITSRSVLNIHDDDDGEDEYYVYVLCRVTRRRGWLPLKFLNPARPFEWSSESLRIGDWIDARFSDDRWHVAQIVRRNEDGFTIRAHDELTRCDWQHVRVVQSITDGIAFFGDNKKLSSRFGETHRGNRHREFTQQVTWKSTSIAPLGTKCARDQWAKFLSSSSSSFSLKKNENASVVLDSTKTSSTNSPQIDEAMRITQTKIQSSFLSAVCPKVLDSSTTSSALELVSSTIRGLTEAKGEDIVSSSDISETFLWRTIDSKMNMNPELLFHALERLTSENRSLGSVLNLVLSLSRSDVRHVKMRSSSILDIIRNAYFVTTTYSRKKKSEILISSHRVQAENRIAAFYEENVRRRGEGNVATPTLEEIASFFKIPLDALIRCLNSLGPEVQLLITALSLGTSSIGEVLLSRIRRCVLEKHSNNVDIDATQNTFTSTNKDDSIIPCVYRLVFPEMNTLTKDQDRTPRRLGGCSSTGTCTNSTGTTMVINEEAKVASKNNRETKSSSAIFESTVSSMTAEQMSVELMGSVANLAQLVVSRGSFVTTENKFCMSTRPETFSALALLLRQTWDRVRKCFGDAVSSSSSTVLLVSCLKLTGANMENLIRLRDTMSNFESICESLRPTLEVLADMSRHLLGVSFDLQTFETTLDSEDMMNASKHKTLVTILARTIRISIPFFLNHEQKKIIKFFHNVLESASNDVQDEVFYGRTRLFIDLMENIHMPTISNDVFLLGARLFGKKHEESQVLYRAVNSFILNHQLGILAESSACLAGSSNRMQVYTKQLLSLALCPDRNMLIFLLHPFNKRQARAMSRLDEEEKDEDDKPTSVLGSFLCALSCLPSTILLRSLTDMLPDFVNLLSHIRPRADYVSESQRRVVEQWLCHVVGGISRDLIVGPSLILSECDLSMWLNSPMFLGGLNDCDVENGEHERSVWETIATNDDNIASSSENDLFEIFHHTSDLENFDVPELDNSCRYVPSGEECFKDVVKKCSAFACKYEECLGFQIHRDLSSFENIRYVVFKAGTRFVHKLSRSVKDTKRSGIVTYVKRSFGTTPSLFMISKMEQEKKKKYMIPELEHLDWIFRLYISWKPSKALKSDLWCMFQALLRRGGTKAMGKFRRMVKDRKVVRCWTLMLASLLHHTNTSMELRKAWDRADHKNLPLPLTDSLRNVARQFARMLKRLNREKEFWAQEELLRAEERRSQQLVPPSPRMSPMRTPEHSPSSRNFFLSSPRNATASSPRRGDTADVNTFKNSEKNILEANEPVGSCDSTTRLHIAVASNWPGSFEEHLNQTIKRSLLCLKLLPASNAIEQSTRGPKLEKLATQQQSLLPSSLQENVSAVGSYDQLQWLVSRKPSQSRVWDHMSSLLQTYNRRNSYSAEEDEEYVHEFDSEFVGLNSSDVALHSVSSFLLLGTGVRTEIVEEVLGRRTCRAVWRCKGINILNQAFNETHISSTKAILIRNLASGLESRRDDHVSHHLSRHHASRLHGCSQVMRHRVASKFADLCSDLVRELASCYAAGNLSLSSQILQFWSHIDTDLLDIPFMYGLGIVPLIQKLASFESLNETTNKSSSGSSSKIDVEEESNSNNFATPPKLRSRDSKEVRDGLISGSITKEDVVRHLKNRLSQQQTSKDKHWIHAQLQGSVRDAVNRHTTSSLSALYRVIEYDNDSHGSDGSRSIEAEGNNAIQTSQSEVSRPTGTHEVPPPLPKPRISRGGLDPLPLVRVRSIDQGRHDLQLHWWSTHMGSLPVIAETPSTKKSKEQNPCRFLSLLLYQKIMRSLWTLTVGCNTIYDPPPCTETVNRDTLISTSASERMMIRRTSHMRAIQKSIERSTKAELRFVTRQIGPLKARLENQLVDLIKRDFYLAAKTLNSKMSTNKTNEDLSRSATRVVRTHAATICAMCRCTYEIDVTMMLSRMLLRDVNFVTSLSTLLRVVSSNEKCILLRALRALLVVSPSSSNISSESKISSPRRRGGDTSMVDRLLSDVFSLKIMLNEERSPRVNFGPWLIEWLLETIGTARTGESAVIDTTEIGGSVAKKRIASEAVMLYRVILELPIWRITASMRVEQNLSLLRRVIEGGSCSDSSAALIEGIATLDILGGFARIIRPGHIANVWTDNSTEITNETNDLEYSKRELSAAIVLDHLSGTHSMSRVLFFSGQSDSVILRTAEMKNVSSSAVITQNEDEISPSKLILTPEQLEIFVGLIRHVEENSVQRHQIRALAIRAISEQLKVEKNAETVFGHELQILLMSASLKCPTYVRQSHTKPSVLMRWNDTENLYLDVTCLENTIVFSDKFEDERNTGANIFQIHGDEADVKIINLLYEECEGKYSRKLCRMALRLYPRICSDRKGKAVTWLRKWGSTYAEEKMGSFITSELVASASSKASESPEKNLNELSLHDIISEPECLVGLRVAVRWLDDVFYEGNVSEYSSITQQHHVSYDDGDQRWYDWATRFSGSSIDDWHLIEMNETELLSLVPRRRNLIIEFIGIAPDADRRTACYYLQKSCFHLQRALQNYFDSGHQSPPSEYEMPSQFIANTSHVTTKERDEIVVTVVKKKDEYDVSTTAVKNHNEEAESGEEAEEGEEDTEICTIPKNSTSGDNDASSTTPTFDSNDESGLRYTEQQLKEKPLLLVGQHVSVLWDDMVWYTGEVLEYDHINGQYHVVYEDGDERWYDWSVRFSKSRSNHWKLVQIDPYEIGKLYMIRKHAMDAFVAFTFATTRTAVFFLLQTNFDVERAIACFFAEAKAPPMYWTLPQWVFYDQTLTGASIECQQDQEEELDKEKQSLLMIEESQEDDKDMVPIIRDCDEEEEKDEDEHNNTLLEPAAEALAHAAQSVVIQIAEKVAALSRDTVSVKMTTPVEIKPSLPIDLDTVTERLKSSNIKEKLQDWNMYFKRRIRRATRTMTLEKSESTLSEILGDLCRQDKLEDLRENLEHVPKDLQNISYLALLHVEHCDSTLPERISGFSVNCKTGEILLHGSVMSSTPSKKQGSREIFPLVIEEEWITFTKKEIDTPPSAPSMILNILKDRCIVLPLMAQKAHVQENLIVFVQELFRSKNLDEKHIFSGRGAILASTILKIDSIMQWDHIEKVMSSIAIRVAARNFCWLHPKEREKLRRNFHDAVSVWGSVRGDMIKQTAQELEISETQSKNLMSLLHLIEMDEDSFVSHETDDLSPQNHQKSNNVVIFEDATESQDPALWCRTSSGEHVSDNVSIAKKSKMSNSKNLLSTFAKTRFARFCSSQVNEDTKAGRLVLISEATLRGRSRNSSTFESEQGNMETMRIARLIRVHRGSFLVRYFDTLRDCIVEKYIRASDCRVLKRLWGASVNSKTHIQKALNSTSLIVASMAAREALVCSDCIALSYTNHLLQFLKKVHPNISSFVLTRSNFYTFQTQVRLLLIKVNPNISLSSKDANHCIRAFGGAKSLMRLVKIMVASDGPQFARDGKISQESSRKSLKLRNCLKHLLLGEARTLREQEGKVKHVKDTLIYEVKLQTLRHCRTSKTLSTTTTETAKTLLNTKTNKNSMTLESLHPLFVTSRSSKQCFVVFSEESFLELTLSKYQLSSDMRLRVYGIGRSSQHRSIDELDSISRGEPFLDIVGDDLTHENEADVSKLFVPFSSVLVELSIKTKRRGITSMWGYRLEFNSLDMLPSGYEEGEGDENTTSSKKKSEIWSMEWGSWLLQILLEVEMIHLKSSKKSRPIRILARAELTKSMIHYLRTPGAQNKDLVIRLLTDLLRQYTLDTNNRDDDYIMPLNDLKRIGRLTMNLIRDTIGNEEFIPQKRLQLLMELTLVTDLADQKIRPPKFSYDHLEFVSNTRDDDGYTLGHAQQGPWHLLRSNPMLILWRRISVYWAGERRWFKGTVTHFSYPLRYTIEYDDGDVRERNFEDLFRQNPKWKWRMLPQNVTLLRAVESTEKVKEKCDVHESGVGVLDVTKGECLIGIGHIERDETKWWCGHTVDGLKTGIFPVSAVSEVCTGDWCLFAKFTDCNKNKFESNKNKFETSEQKEEEEEKEEKEKQKEDDVYVGDQAWLNVTVLDENNEDDLTTDNDATATDDGTEDDVDDDVERNSNNSNNNSTVAQNDEDNIDAGVDGDQSNDNESSNDRNFPVQNHQDNNISRRYHRDVRISTASSETIPILRNLRTQRGLISMFESSRFMNSRSATTNMRTDEMSRMGNDRWSPRTFFGAISSNESIWIRLGQILLAQHRQQRLDHIRERRHVRESDRQTARMYVTELEESTKTITSHVLESTLKNLVCIANSLLSEEESEEEKRKADQSVNLQVVGWINDLVAKGKVTSFLVVKPTYIAKLLNKISEADDVMKRLVNSLGIPNILRKMGVLQRFNRLLRYRNVQRLIDMSSTSLSGIRPESLGDKFRLLSPLVFLENKMSLLETALSLTKCDDVLGELVIDQYLAMQSAERKLTHPSQSHSIFCQAFRTLHGRDHRLFRSAQLQQSIHVTFRRSPVVDAGGVFRETMSSIVESVFSDQLTLLIPTPNQTSGTGLGQDLFVPNPDATTPLEIRMFEFLGIMLGIAIRNTFPMPFRFPESIYRRILRDERTDDLVMSSDVVVEELRRDLRQVDRVAYDLLEAVRNCESEGVTNQDEFEEMFGSQLVWTTSSVSGAAVALRKSVTVPVRFEERKEYCDAVHSYRHKELRPSLRAMRRGLSTVVPMTGLQLFTASEFEVLVCGALEIDWKYLRRHTKYENYRKSSRAVRWFWKIFREMSQQERSLFIKYVWGRERLPRGNEVWKQPFLISRCPDITMLPVAHTCFFKIDLPPYPTIEEMREKIHIAMASANAPISMLLA